MRSKGHKEEKIQTEERISSLKKSERSREGGVVSIRSRRIRKQEDEEQGT